MNRGTNWSNSVRVKWEDSKLDGYIVKNTIRASVVNIRLKIRLLNSGVGHNKTTSLKGRRMLKVPNSELKINWT